ncbi:hypothetical protein I317_07909 [Kwoniella heveanensis CBS 569]|nr:hypothetical protein I317_07909 [Kwoniella heveanensis CBS 569]
MAKKAASGTPEKMRSRQRAVMNNFFIKKENPKSDFNDEVGVEFNNEVGVEPLLDPFSPKRKHPPPLLRNSPLRQPLAGRGERFRYGWESDGSCERQPSPTPKSREPSRVGEVVRNRELRSKPKLNLPRDESELEVSPRTKRRRAVQAAELEYSPRTKRWLAAKQDEMESSRRSTPRTERMLWSEKARTAKTNSSPKYVSTPSAILPLTPTSKGFIDYAITSPSPSRESTTPARKRLSTSSGPVQKKLRLTTSVSACPPSKPSPKPKPSSSSYPTPSSLLTGRRMTPSSPWKLNATASSSSGPGTATFAQASQSSTSGRFLPDSPPNAVSFPSPTSRSLPFASDPQTAVDIEILLNSFSEFRKSGKLGKGSKFSQVQQVVQDQLGHQGVISLFDVGQRAIPIFNELRTTGTLTPATIHKCRSDFITDTQEWDVAGVYLDLGVKGQEWSGQFAGYVGSACSLSKRSRKGLRQRIFEGHEDEKHRVENPCAHYKLGYPTDAAHRYVCLWELPEALLCQLLGFSKPELGKDSYSEEEKKRRRELRGGAVTVIEALFIRLLGMHSLQALDKIVTRRGFKPPTLKLGPLNRATALEWGGDQWSVEQCRAYGKINMAIHMKKWRMELGKGEGEAVCPMDVIEFRKGKEFVADLHHRRGSKAAFAGLTRTFRRLTGSGWKSQYNYTTGLRLTKYKPLIRELQRLGVEGIAKIPNNNVRVKLKNDSRLKHMVRDGEKLVWRVDNPGGEWDPNQVSLKGYRDKLVAMVLDARTTKASSNNKSNFNGPWAQFRIFVLALKIMAQMVADAGGEADEDMDEDSDSEKGGDSEEEAVVEDEGDEEG